MTGQQTESHPQQLHMVWPETRAMPPTPVLPAEYVLRSYRSGDEESYLQVMHDAGFTGFDAASVKTWLDRILPEGLFFIEYRPSAQIVATALAAHNPSPLHPFGGELGWVAGSPDHANRGLGRAVCTAVVRRFLSAGYRRIYLKTDDWRRPALKVYLGMGFEPLLYAPDVEARWQVICEQLNWPFRLENWPR